MLHLFADTPLPLRCSRLLVQRAMQCRGCTLHPNSFVVRGGLHRPIIGRKLPPFAHDSQSCNALCCSVQQVLSVRAHVYGNTLSCARWRYWLIGPGVFITPLPPHGAIIARLVDNLSFDECPAARTAVEATNHHSHPRACDLISA